MPAYPSGNTADDAVLTRVTDSYFWGKDVTARVVAPIALNNDPVLAVNAAGTGTVELFRLTTGNKLQLGANPTLGAAQLFYESFTDPITAHSGGGQSLATQLVSEVNRVATAAASTAPFDSVVLPATTGGGLGIMVINNAANPIQVFGLAADTVDGQTNTVGVTQMANSVVFYFAAAAGKWFSEGLATGWGGPGLQTLSWTTGITAFSTGGQTNALALTSMLNRLNTVAAQGDSVRLPTANPGMMVVIDNQGAFAAQVFGAGTDTINGIATATGISQGVKTVATYVCFVAGNWEVPITSLVSTAPVALSVNGAIPAHVSHTYSITKAGVLADTLAAPTSGADDGLEIIITSTTAFAHTLTATGLLATGTASVNVATFAAFAGAGLTLMALGGKWQVVCSVGITFS